MKKLAKLFLLLGVVLLMLGAFTFYLELDGDNISPQNSTSTPSSDNQELSPPEDPTWEEVGTGTNPVLGSTQAPVTMIVFQDFESQFSQDFYHDVYKPLKESYIEEGKLKLHFRDFPFSNLHPTTTFAHQAARCAGQQEAFWDYHDLLFEKDKELNLENLTFYARNLDLNVAKFRSCLQNDRFISQIESSYKEAESLGLKYVPAIFISTTTPKVDIANISYYHEKLEERKSISMDSTWYIVGNQKLKEFRQIIDRFLTKTETKKATTTSNKNGQ